MSWEDAMEIYLRFPAAEGLRGATLTDYRQKIGQFFRTYPNSWPDSVEEPLLEWLATAKSPATYNLRLGAMKLFLNWAVGKQLVPCNPVASFHMRKKSDRIVDIPEEVIRELFTLPDRKTYVGLRDYALFTVFLDTGIRPSECFKLVPGDFNFRTQLSTVRAEVSKTHQQRDLPLSDATMRAIEEFLGVRPPDWKPSDLVSPITVTSLEQITDPSGGRLKVKVYHNVSSDCM
jgi:integrase